MKISNLILCLVLFVSVANAANVDFFNDREGESFYKSRSFDNAIKKAHKQVHPNDIINAFEETESELDEVSLCSFDVNQKMVEKLQRIEPRFNTYEGALNYLRTQDQLDDTILKILLTAHETKETKVKLPKNTRELRLPNKTTVESALNILQKYEGKYQNTCLDEAYTSLYSDLLRLNKGLTSRHVEALFAEAYKQKLISLETYEDIEKARVNKLETNGINLKSYYRKQQSLRAQFPLRDPDERSSFVTSAVSKEKMSRRQRLYESYTDIQIIIMADIIKKLRTRLEAPKAEILIYDRNQGVETIDLEPMERFRLAIKLLRKEMSLLSLHTFFAGRTPGYMDLMTAAYETGIIPAIELEEVAGLEEVWNPKKSFWEKARVWVNMFSSVATVAIPAPYGFIPALVVVVIEMTAGEQNNNSNDPTVLF